MLLSGTEGSSLEFLHERLHAERRVLLLDTRHSGEAFGEGKRGLALDSFDQQEVDAAAGSGLYIVAASSEAGFARAMRGNGLFTRALLEGLDDLKTFATRAVHERSAGRQRPTEPRIEGGEDFPLVYGR